MRIIIVILAGLVATFGGGCLVMLGGSAITALLLGLAVIILNVAAILAAINPSRWASWFLTGFGAVEILGGLLLLPSARDRVLGDLVLLGAGLLAIKGLVEILGGAAMWRKVE